tara:strand:- start:617 stop:961 length:345 start_codon:yes stop_codon:yes gene_type:complete
MGKVNALSLEHEEHVHVLIDAFKAWLIKLDEIQAATEVTITQQILTNVLENSIDIDVARYDWFYNHFVQEFLQLYVEDYSSKYNVDLSADVLWQVNEEQQYGLYGMFENYLREL